jgi:hypothetical protein
MRLNMAAGVEFQELTSLEEEIGAILAAVETDKKASPDSKLEKLAELSERLTRVQVPCA